jgi:sterol desaturase/sphingolipid hydroxylase (fatty acid hydroxylase superfamily)
MNHHETNVLNSKDSVRPKVSGSRQLFASPILEKLSRTHIAVPVMTFIAYGSTLLFWSIKHTSLSVLSTVLMFIIGLITFSWVEYNVHRYIFHIEPSSSFKKRFQYVVHGVHHEFPKDKDRLAMPPLLSIVIATVLLLSFRLIMGDLVFSFMPGFMTGYAAYLSVHYIVHAIQPPKNFLRALWVNHAIHHYKNDNLAFGVSSPLWDYVYGTMVEKKKNI